MIFNLYEMSRTKPLKAVRAFGSFKNDEQMDKLYEKINEHYKTINRELINDIVHRRAFGSGRSL